MASFFLDGSALANRYVPETGSSLVDFILDYVPEHRIFLLNIGAAEVVSVLVRKRNAGILPSQVTHPVFRHAFNVFARMPTNLVD